MANVSDQSYHQSSTKKIRASKLATWSLRSAFASGMVVGATWAIGVGPAQANGTEYVNTCFPLNDITGGPVRRIGTENASWLLNSAEAEINCGDGPYSGYACIQQRWDWDQDPDTWQYLKSTCARQSGEVVTSGNEYFYPDALSEQDLFFLPSSKGNHVSHYAWAFSGYGP